MGLLAVAGFILTAALGGCATLDRGAEDQIYVVSEPEGATVTISTESGTCVTPCGLDVKRGDNVTVFVAKDGYDDQSMEVKTRSVAPANADSPEVTPDYLGRVIDYRLGANLIHVPNPVVFKLAKSGAP